MADRKKVLCVIILFASIFISESLKGQNSDLVINGFNLTGALIPIEEIRHGGPPRDGIPSIDNPKFSNAHEARFPGKGDRVLGVRLNGIAKAYPIGILNYHEIVNDHFDSTSVVITYCPLCGSGVAFYTNVGNKNRTFGVSGLLYNSDVLLYDRGSGSLWSQLMGQAVTGELSGAKLEIIPTSNTTWKEWKTRNPNTLVLSDDTGFQRDYTQTPYTGYDDSEGLYFPVSNTSNKYHPKELVIGIEINGIFKAYPHEELMKSNEVVNDSIGHTTVRIQFNKKDKSGIITDVSGDELPHYTSFWFSWYAFHPNTLVYIATEEK